LNSKLEQQMRDVKKQYVDDIWQDLVKTKNCEDKYKDQNQKYQEQSMNFGKHNKIHKYWETRIKNMKMISNKK
jgi:hypothetical protein